MFFDLKTNCCSAEELIHVQNLYTKIYMCVFSFRYVLKIKERCRLKYINRWRGTSVNSYKDISKGMEGCRLKLDNKHLVGFAWQKLQY